MILTALLVTLLTGAPVEISTKDQLKPAMGQSVVVRGTVERVDIGKGGKSWKGTAIVLDDGAVIYVTYNAPPEGWEALLGKLVRAEGTLANQSSLTEQSLVAPHLKPSAKPTPATRDWKALLKGRITVRGLAEDAKGGAVLLVEDRPIYVKGKSSWPAAVRGTRVTVSGTLRDEAFLPVATKGPGGVISQGTSESTTQLTLEPSRE